MQLEIRKYETRDAMQAAAVWNEVVRGGEAFPQMNELTERDADEFFSSQSFGTRARSSACISCIRTTSIAAAISATQATR